MARLKHTLEHPADARPCFPPNRPHLPCDPLRTGVPPFHSALLPTRRPPTPQIFFTHPLFVPARRHILLRLSLGVPHIRAATEDCEMIRFSPDTASTARAVLPTEARGARPGSFSGASGRARCATGSIATSRFSGEYAPFGEGSECSSASGKGERGHGSGRRGRGQVLQQVQASQVLARQSTRRKGLGGASPAFASKAQPQTENAEV